MSKTSSIMLVTRSLLFNALFYLNMIVLMIVGLPTLLIGKNAIFALARIWAHSSNWLLRTICGLKTEFRGVENIPRGGYIIAPKHQSIWETFSLVPFAPDFSYILKRELKFIPVFGLYLVRAQQIGINRSSGKAALREASQKSSLALAAGRQIFIFPEGTRRPPGALPAYKFGVAKIYEDARVPCLPVALNSGLFWPRRSFIRRPGTIIVEFLPPIAPGLQRAEFLATLTDRLETTTNRLIAESLAADPSLRDRLAVPNPDQAPASRSENQARS